MIAITLARKPLEGTVAQNILTHGTGGLNLDGCRIPYTEGNRPAEVPGNDGSDVAGVCYGTRHRVAYTAHPLGRFPGNVILLGKDVGQDIPDGLFLRISGEVEG